MSNRPFGLLGRAFVAVLSPVVPMLLVAPAAQAVVTPYFNDFSSDVSDFTETSNAQWNLTGTGLYRNTISAANTASSAVVQVPEFGGSPAVAKDWEVSTRFTITASTGGDDNTVGIAALGSTSGLGTFYLGDVQIGQDDMRLVLVNPNNIQVDEDAGFNVTTNIPYELTMAGKYLGNSLLLSLTITDLNTPANTHTISTTFNGLVGPQGQFFGLRNRTSGAGGSTLNVDFDHLTIRSLEVPEPATLSLLGLAGLGLVSRRRRLA